MRETILIVDDDRSVGASLALLLKQAGYRSRAVTSPEDALAALEAERFDLVLQDMNFSRKTTGEEGLDLLARIKARRPALPVVLITAWGSISLAVRGMQAGASDFVTKPWNNQHMLASVETALGLAAAAAVPTGTLTRESIDALYDFDPVAGRDPKLLRVLDVAGRVAATD